MAGEYQGSQAYGLNPGGNESVNRNTGSVTYSKTLVDLRGVLPSINFNLQISYTPGQSGTSGLPRNWSFSTPFVIPGKSVTTQQRTYVIDPTWADATGFQSGLRYINDHSMKFESVSPSQPLPSGRPGLYAWRFKMSDGGLDYYDDAGKILEHADIFGNTIYYQYLGQGEGPKTALIDLMIDSWGQTINFAYQTGEMIQITSPDGGKTQLTISNQGIEEVIDPEGYHTSFTYVSVASQTVLSTIQHPTSLQTRFEYQTLNFLDDNGNQRALPAVQDHYRLDINQKVLSQTNYRFGEATAGCTYTGYTSGYKMGGQNILSDKAGFNMRSRYDTLISNLDEAGNILSATRVFFNYLHLPMQEMHYSIEGGTQLVDAYQAQYTYFIPADEHARSTNYKYPTVTEQLHYNTKASPPGYQPLRRSTSQYDDYGCILQSLEEMWNPSSNTYVKQQSILSSWTEVAWGGEMLQSETFIDEISGFQKQVLYTLTSDQKNIQSSLAQYQAKGDSGFQPWKTKTLEYDSAGRITSETVAWSEGIEIPDKSVSSFTNSNSYQFDPAGYEVVSAKDPQGHVTISKYDLKAKSGRIISKTLPLGQTEMFTYDLIGRCTEHTDPFGKKTINSYTVGAAGNTATSTSSLGYVTTKIFDTVGNTVEVQDNGDPSQSPESPRVLSRASYDSLSRVMSKTNELGLVTTYNSYDAFNRILSATDPKGNTETHVYDDSSLSTTHYMNGDLRGTSQLDEFGRDAFTTQYADSGDSKINYSLGKQLTYDGFGNIVQTSLLEVPRDGSTPIQLETVNYVFNVENAVLRKTTSTKTDLAENSYDSVQRDMVYDIFGLCYTQSKTVRYHDSQSFERQGAINICDSCKLLVSYQNQLDQEEKYEYDANGFMTSMYRFDGTLVSYTSDAVGRLLSLTSPSQNLTKSYLDNGRVAHIATSTSQTRYKYSLDGCITGVVYSADAEQIYELDKYSRIAQDTDALGTVHGNTFDSQGRISSRTSGPDTASFNYGLVNHTYGQLVGIQVAGSQQIQKTLSYDGFGHANQVIVSNPQTQDVLLKVNYTYNSKGKLKLVESSSATLAVPESNYRREFLYDGLGQLRQDTTTYTNNTTATHQYAYDGNSNVISTTVDGKITLRNYNSIDQRIDPGFKYDLNGRQVSDDQGRTYSYGSDDQLSAVRINGSEVAFDYHADSSLSSHNSSAGQTNLYYDCGGVNATQTKGGENLETSYLVASGTRLAAHSTNASNPSTYFIDNQGSIALELSGPVETASYYEAYGSRTDSSIAPVPAYGFGFKQEFTDNASGLVYLRSRWYQPDQASFLTMDRTPKENRYAFCAGDPVNLFDGTGHDETGMAAGLVVGIVATIAMGVLTGGIAAELFGPECIQASIAAGSVSGAAGNLAGDGTQAAIDDEKFTGSRAGEDMLSGAVGGAVGAGTGGKAGRAAMRAAMNRGWSQRAVTAVGSVVSGTIGGAAGNFSGGETMAAMKGQPLFSSDTALSLVTGAVSGLGGGMLESGCYVGILDSKIMPVPLTNEEIQAGTSRIVVAANRRAPPGGWQAELYSLVPQAEANEDDEWFERNNRPANDAQRIPFPGHPNDYDTVVCHGGRAEIVTPNVRTTTRNGGSFTMMRPMKGRLLADHLAYEAGWRGQAGDIKMTVCHAGWSNAQLVADATQRNVWATYSAVAPEGEGVTWRRYTPR
ncbi:hypothetical protein F5884DRAFT_756625 [Xylogone sp. PMI_703]|nr:hypothetical protein F5884DRAFT_756625 [Xylogone sp. PMI_703]